MSMSTHIDRIEAEDEYSTRFTKLQEQHPEASDEEIMDIIEEEATSWAEAGPEYNEDR